MTVGGAGRSILAFERRYSARLTDAEFDRLARQVGKAAAGREPAACELLGKWLADEQSDTRRVVILDAMAASSCLQAPSDLLVELVKVRHADLASAAARLLVLSGAEGEAALLRALPAIGSYARYRCLSTLLYGREQLGEEAVRAVADLTEYGDRDLRTAGLTVLALRGDGSCTDRLVGSLRRRDPATREAALKALAVVGDSRAVDAVLARLEKDVVRGSDPHSPMIDLELTYLARHAELHPEAFERACAAVAKNWRRRDSAELEWIRSFLHQTTPEGLRSVGIPADAELQRMRGHVVDGMRVREFPGTIEEIDS